MDHLNYFRSCLKGICLESTDQKFILENIMSFPTIFLPETEFIRLNLLAADWAEIHRQIHFQSTSVHQTTPLHGIQTEIL
jgi:hypothetical protein